MTQTLKKYIIGKEHSNFERIMNGLNLSQDYLNKQYTTLFFTQTQSSVQI